MDVISPVTKLLEEGIQCTLGQGNASRNEEKLKSQERFGENEWDFVKSVFFLRY